MSMLRNVLAAAALMGSAVTGLSLGVVSTVSAAEQGGQKFSKNVATALKAAQDATKELSRDLVATVRQNPVTSLAVAVAIGFTLGLIARRN